MRLAFLSAVVAIVAVTIGMLDTPWGSAAINTAAAYRLDTYALQLNGDTQYVTGLDGGFVVGTVVTEDTGLMPKKHLSGATIQPVHARVRVDQFTPFLADSLEGKITATDGAAYYIDNSGNVAQERDYSQLVLTDLAFPAISGSPKQTPALQLTLTLAPQQVKANDGMPGTTPPVKVTTGPKAKTWSGNYRFQVPGMPTNRISMIEPFIISRKLASDPAGSDPKAATIKPSQWQIPNLVFYMPPQDSLAWLAWHDDFVVKGNNSDAQEKTFTLDLVSQDFKDTYLELQGTGVGIVSAKLEQPVTASVTQGFRVEIYVESMKIVTSTAPLTVVPVAPTVVGTVPTITKPVSPTSRPVRGDVGNRPPIR